MSAAISDLLTQATNGTRASAATLTVIKGVGASTITCNALTGWPTATAVHFSIYTVINGVKTVGSQTDWKGVVAGSTITALTLRAGTDQAYPIGAIVEAAPTAAWNTDLINALLLQHNQDGTHGALTAASLVLAGTNILNLLTPAGAMMPFAGTVTPTGWLLADGTAVSRTTYSGLFGVIGTTYGAGNGSTTFALPDARGRILAGKAATGTFATLGGTMGVETIDSTHAHATDAQGNHSHGGGTGYYASNGGGSDVITTHTGASPPSHYHGISLDGNHGHNVDSRLGVSSIVQPTLVVNQIIKT